MGSDDHARYTTDLFCHFSSGHIISSWCTYESRWSELIPEWISNPIPSKVRDKISYLLQNFNARCSVELDK